MKLLQIVACIKFKTKELKTDISTRKIQDQVDELLEIKKLQEPRFSTCVHLAYPRPHPAPTDPWMSGRPPG